MEICKTRETLGETEMAQIFERNQIIRSLTGELATIFVLKLLMWDPVSQVTYKTLERIDISAN